MSTYPLSRDEELERDFEAGLIFECIGCGRNPRSADDPDGAEVSMCSDCRDLADEVRAEQWREDEARRAAWDAETSECFDAFADPWSWEQR